MPGRKVGPRYIIESLLGVGSEGEVYQISELETGILRAAKFYFPHRDPKKRQSILSPASSTPCVAAPWCCSTTIQRSSPCAGNRSWP